MSKLLYHEETYKIIGKCMSVHNNLGHGFLEIVYKEALAYEFKKENILFEREKLYRVKYDKTYLPHHFYADFVVFDKIILEIKADQGIYDEYIAQAINYLKVSGNRLALIVSFGDMKMNYKRIIL